MLTAEQIADLERLAAAATPGPWTKGRSYESVIAPITPGAPDPREDARHYGGELVAESVFVPGNIAFIATAREAVPALIARVRELEATLKPFAVAAADHGVRASKDDLWVSLGVAGSAWIAARAALPDAKAGA